MRNQINSLQSKKAINESINDGNKTANLIGKLAMSESSRKPLHRRRVSKIAQMRREKARKPKNIPLLDTSVLSSLKKDLNSNTTTVPNTPREDVSAS